MAEDAGAAPDDVQEKLLQWVERAGFALELRVARAMVRRQMAAEPSEYFWDEHTGKRREIDVVGRMSRRNQAHRVQVVIECKSGRRHAWVIFTDPHRWIQPQDEFSRLLVRGTDAATDEAIWRNVRGMAALSSPSAGYAITEARLGHQQEADDDGPNVAYRAVRKAATAAVDVHLGTPPMATDEGRAFGQVTLPVVVTAAPLYECSLASDGSVSLIRTAATSLYAVLDGRPEPVLVQVMNEAHFSQDWLGTLPMLLEYMA